MMNTNTHQPRHSSYQARPIRQNAQSTNAINNNWQNKHYPKNTFNKQPNSISKPASTKPQHTYKYESTFYPTTNLLHDSLNTKIEALATSNMAKTDKDLDNKMPNSNIQQTVDNSDLPEGSTRKGSENARFTIAKRENLTDSDKDNNSLTSSKPLDVDFEKDMIQQEDGTHPELASFETEWPTLATSGQMQPTRSALKTLSKNSLGSPSRSLLPQSTSQLRLSLPERPIKLITGKGHFIEENADTKYLLDSNSAFTVVGVVGLHSSGKSSVLNALLNSALPGREVSGENFSVESVDRFADNAAQTEGVDLQISRERLLLLDTQPVLSLESAEALIHIAASERRAGLGSAQPEFITVETGATIHALQLCSFLMSVSHVVLVVIDNWCDFDILRQIELADMLRPAVLEETEFQPRIIFVLNKCDAVSTSLAAVLRDFCQTLSALFQNTQFHFDSRDVFTLPLVKDYDDNSLEAFKRSIKQLRKRVLTTTRHHMLPKSLFNEKVWHQFAGQVWDGVQKSVMLAEYHRLIG